MNLNKSVVVFGGNGFIGKYIIKLLVEAGCIVRVVTRNTRNAEYLKVGAGVGQVTIVKGDIRGDVEKHIDGVEIVINLVGILNNQRQDFYDIHVSGADKISKAAAKMNAEKLIHFSSLIMMDKLDKSDYGKTKKAGEKKVIQNFPNAIVLRPSMVFAKDDGFLKQLISISIPFVPVVGGGKTIVQPVYVMDIAKFVIELLKRDINGGVYNLLGPDVHEFRDIIKKYLDFKGSEKKIISIPQPLAYIMAVLMELRIFSIFMKPMLGTSEPLLTRDQLIMLGSKKVFESSHFEDFGIKPQSLAEVFS